MTAVYLASSSPRRATLLATLGIVPTVVSHQLDQESIPSQGSATVAVSHLSKEKALSVSSFGDGYLLAGDTIVLVPHTPFVSPYPTDWDLADARVFGKPQTEDEARQMLCTLETTPHMVVSGLCIRTPDQVVSGADVAIVQLKPLSHDEREAYIAGGHPFDKAGGYGIQDGLTEWWEGDISTILGLSLPLLKQLASQMGWALPVSA